MGELRTDIGLCVSLAQSSTKETDVLEGNFEVRSAAGLDRLIAILQALRPCFEALASHSAPVGETHD